MRDARDRPGARSTLAGEGYDLLLVYFRSPDIVSHNHWKSYEPEAFEGAADLRERDRVPRSYEAVDQALGRLLEAGPKDMNVLVISDHGFHAARPEEVKVLLDMDAVLKRLGYQDRIHTYGTPSFRQVKLLRFSRVPPAEREELRRRLAADLAAVTYESGAPVFVVREARPREMREGADFVAVVETEGATQALLIRGERFEGAIESLSRISGTHTRKTHGIFLAAGPDVDPDAELGRDPGPRHHAHPALRARSAGGGELRGQAPHRSLHGGVPRGPSRAHDPVVGEAEERRSPDLEGGREAPRRAPGSRLHPVSAQSFQIAFHQGSSSSAGPAALRFIRPRIFWMSQPVSEARVWASRSMRLGSSRR